jgi:hypothetical protein
LATHDDSHNDGRDTPRFGSSPWQGMLQFTWALLGDWPRIRALVFLVAVAVTALVVLKGSYAGVTHDLAQNVPHWFVKSLLVGGVGTTIVGGQAASVYRKIRRARLAEDRPSAEAVEGATAEPVQKESAEDGDDGLGEPREG